MKKTQVVRLIAYVTGMVNQQLLLQNEYLLAENRILRVHLRIRLLLTDPERSTLAVLGKHLGRQDRIAGALHNLGHRSPIKRWVTSDTSQNRRQQTSWADFIRSQMTVLIGIDFFTTEVLTWLGRPIMHCSSCTWRRVASRRPKSLNIRRKNGCCKWPGSDKERLAIFRRVRDELRTYLD
jgi:hypothetical protein